MRSILQRVNTNIFEFEYDYTHNLKRLKIISVYDGMDQNYLNITV